MIKKIILTFTIIFSFLMLFTQCNNPVSENENTYLDIDKRANDLLQQMTLEEKIFLLGGYESDGMRSNGIERLGIPKLNMANGPHGLGGIDDATFFAGGVSFGATWNPELVEEVGKAIGAEARFADKHIMLGPCVNIHRLPIGGRNFESYSEDPFLTSKIGVAWIKGVQSMNVAACVKHYAGNEQEFERNGVNVEMDERTLREIHLPAFKAAVQEANTYTVMSAYNRFRGSYASENDYLLNKVLRDDFGFTGFVISDWDATHSCVPSALGGLDMEMPGPPMYFGDSLMIAVKNKEVSVQIIDQKVINILKIMIKLGILDDYSKMPKGEIGTDYHKMLSRKVTEQSVVLLKNACLPGQDNQILPLNKEKIKSIAILGPKAEEASLGGGGSSEVFAKDSISLIEGLRNKLGADVEITFLNGIDFTTEFPAIESKNLYTEIDGKEVNGLTGVYYNNVHLHGEPVLTRVDKDVNFDWGQGSPDPKVVKDGFSVRWSGKLKATKEGMYKIGINSNDGSKLFVNGKLFVHNWGNHGAKMRSAPLYMKTGETVDVMIEYFETGNSASMKFEWELQQKAKYNKEVLKLAEKADLVIIAAGLTKIFECEGFDRASMDLPGAQNEMIKDVSKVNPNTIVILTNGTPVTMIDWIDDIPAVLEAFYPGQEEGNALADILFGDVNPSGKLPVTFPKHYEDSPAYKFYPGENSQLTYSEGIYVGYRYYDTKNVEPLFPFGFGLSYTTFEYSNLKIDKKEIDKEDILNIELTVKNTGKVDGDEVVQLYIHDIESKVDRPEKELKGFKRVSLKAGESKTIQLQIDKMALSYYDVETKQWFAEPGEFEILIGSSSKDIRLNKIFKFVK
ncbi:MAG: beta-glucosidase [Bacteroidetes bacterium]|nr:MAG: beta-glucosidase [Bacteroidota bacterium]